jgi:hypothetical protein
MVVSKKYPTIEWFWTKVAWSYLRNIQLLNYFKLRWYGRTQKKLFVGLIRTKLTWSYPRKIICWINLNEGDMVFSKKYPTIEWFWMKVTLSYPRNIQLLNDFERRWHGRTQKKSSSWIIFNEGDMVVSKKYPTVELFWTKVT